MEAKKCPSCGSGKIKVLNPGSAVMDYNCMNCGYRGSFLITDGWKPKTTRTARRRESMSATEA